jgi:hypothetical protein
MTSVQKNIGLKTFKKKFKVHLISTDLFLQFTSSTQFSKIKQ